MKKSNHIGSISFLVVLSTCAYLTLFAYWSPTTVLWMGPFYALAMFYVCKKLSRLPTPVPVTDIQTQLINTRDEFRGVLITIRAHEENGHILVKAAGSPVIKIPMESLSGLLYENKSTKELPMAGFGIDYEDSVGSARLMFFNSGIGSVRRTERIVKELQGAYEHYFAGCRVEPLPVANLTPSVIKAELVHRYAEIN